VEDVTKVEKDVRVEGNPQMEVEVEAE